MKTFNLSVLGWVSVLASGAVARPGPVVFGSFMHSLLFGTSAMLHLDSETSSDRILVLTQYFADTTRPVAQQNRFTAFVNTADGLRVQCWGMGTEQSGSKGASRVMSLATAGQLEGLDILTWPSYSNLYPPASDVDVSNGDVVMVFTPSPL